MNHTTQRKSTHIDVNDVTIQTKYQQALRGLAVNTHKVYGFDQPILIEGGIYPGIWLECGPLEACVYGHWHPEIALGVARASHSIFFFHQRPNGQFPCYVWFETLGWSQIQMVVPIAATAWEVAQQSGDEAFLKQAYQSCCRWDGWLNQYRNTRGTGLVEMFCGHDTGHDASPRTAGFSTTCPEMEARNCNQQSNLPWLAPDLSASRYGGQVALASMASALGKGAESLEWQERAETLRQAIIHYCFDPEDDFFYDVDCQGNFIKVRGDVITRVCGEHVPDQALFERIYARHLKDPASFWTPYPFPSIAVSDPQFDPTIPENSWGGAAQALTALRAPRWMLHYGKDEDLNHLMRQWVTALMQADGFMQQMDPFTGQFNTSQGYSPAMCVMIEFVQRLSRNGKQDQRLQFL